MSKLGRSALFSEAVFSKWSVWDKSMHTEKAQLKYEIGYFVFKTIKNGKFINIVSDSTLKLLRNCHLSRFGVILNIHKGF